MILFFKQKTAYEMRISDWSSDVCSSDLEIGQAELREGEFLRHHGGLRQASGHALAPCGFVLGVCASVFVGGDVVKNLLRPSRERGTGGGDELVVHAARFGVPPGFQHRGGQTPNLATPLPHPGEQPAVPL